MKYGFVYIWFDRKHKRFYVGSHWGTIDDGYVCSSTWMRNAYKRRPQDFRRRILKNQINRIDLIKEEQVWLDQIRSEEIGKRYYNLNKNAIKHWHTDPQQRLTIGQKISASPLRAKRIGDANRGKSRTEEQKQNLRDKAVKQWSDPNQRLHRTSIMTEKWKDPRYRAAMSHKHSRWKWYTNGTDSIKIEDGSSIPEGFVSGRIRKW